ncbi:hypothetical protein [Thermococcus sp.]
MLLLTVEPPEYYPIIDKLFADKLMEGLETFGVNLEEMWVRVIPGDRELFLEFFLKVSKDSGLSVLDLKSFTEGILEKLCEEATSTFGKLYNVKFILKSIEIEEKHARRRHSQEYSLIVDAPQELRDKLERVGKGLAIKLKEWGIEFSGLVLALDRRNIDVVIKIDGKMSDYDKSALGEAVEEKTRAFLKTVLGKEPPVKAKILDAEDRALATILRKMKEMEKEAEELAKMEEVRTLMEALGKTPSP